MTQNDLIHEGERLDELHRNGYFIIQDPARFCFGMDAVLLSGFAQARQGERVLDLGTGTGIIPILMEAKTKASDFFALEIQEESADMARRSVQYNHLEDKIRIITGDMKDASKIFGASSFDIVTTNPPYMIGQHGSAALLTQKQSRAMRFYVIWMIFCGRALRYCAPTDGFTWCTARSVWQRFLPRWSNIKSSRNG